MTEEKENSKRIEESQLEKATHALSTGKLYLRGIIFSLLISLLFIWFSPELREAVYFISDIFTSRPAAADIAEKKDNATKKLESKIATLKRNYDRLTPTTKYLIVNSSDNEIYLMSGRKQLHKGICSTGSYVLLKAADNQQWIFQTPRGLYRVQVKVTNPVWRLPDWAFIEEGRPIPPKNSPERFEYGVLGEYALAFGNGYLIHGTLYTRMLGMPVTHGCVRLGDEDLGIVFHSLSEGSKIYLY